MLGVNREDKCQLAIAAFGRKRNVPQTCEVVRVGMRIENCPDVELTLYAVPYICEPLSVQPILVCAQSYGHLSCLELADSFVGETPLDVDVLVGSDHYWNDVEIVDLWHFILDLAGCYPVP